MPAPGQGQGQPKSAAQKLVLIQAKIGDGTGSDAVQTLMNELQTTFEEGDERRTIEATLQQQMNALQGNAFPLRGATELENNNQVARANHVETITNLRTLHTDFTKALSAIETANPEVDTSELAVVAIRLGGLTEHIDQFQGSLDGNDETQTNPSEDGTAYHGNSANARVKAAENAAKEAKEKAATAEAKTVLKELETAFCNNKLNEANQKLEQLQATGTCLDEQILASYLQMAKDNLVNGQSLIDRIQSLEICSSCGGNNGKKRKLCDGGHAAVSPEVLEDLIKRLTDEIPPQADLVAKITDLLSAIKTRAEDLAQCSSSVGSPSPSTSAQQSSLEQQPDVTMGNTGGLNPILRISNSTLKNGAVLLSRIASLESELHILKHHAEGASGGRDDECPKQLDKAREQLKDALAQLNDKEGKIDQLHRELEETKGGVRDCEENEKNVSAPEIQRLESENIKLRVDLLELEALEREKYLPEISEKDEEIVDLQAQISTLQTRVLSSDPYAQDPFEEKDLEIAKLLQDRDDANENMRLCMESKEKVLQPEIARLKAHIEALKAALHVEDVGTLTLKATDYELLVAQIHNFQERLRVCEKLRQLQGAAGKDDIELANQDKLATLEKEELLQQLKLRNNMINNLRGELNAIKDKLKEQGELQAEIHKSNDLIERLEEAHEERLQKNVDALAKLHKAREAELSQSKDRLEKTQKEMVRQRDEMDNLRRRLRDCQEFKKKVTNLGIENSEEPGDLEGLDNQTLTQEILDLQGKLKACGIALIELEEARERDRHYIPSDEELDEELVNQDQDNGEKRNERLRDLEAGISRLKKALSDCQDNESARNQALQDQITALENDAFQKEVAYREKIDNLEETESMDFLKRGIQKLRDEAKDAKAKLKECKLQTENVQLDAFRAEIDRLKKELLAQQQKCETEKEALRQQVQKLQGNAATPEGTESADIVKLQAEIKRLQEQLAKQEGDLEKEKKTVGLLRKTTNDQYAALQKEKLASAKCNEKLAALRKTQQPGSGFGNPATISATADGEPQKEDILECWAEVARLKHLIANFESEKAGLTNQLQKQREMNTKLARKIMQGHGANNDDYWAEVARLKNLINNLEDEKAKLTKQLQEHEQVNAELTSHFMQSSDGNSNDDDRGDKDHSTAERPLPIGFNDFYPDNVAYDDEIEALNNQITSLKQEIAALEQQAALDKLEIDALKENNTNKSEAYKKFVALVEKLRAELEGLHAKLAECAGETWQERRARMRRLAAANRGPRNPATHRLDPALAQIEEWKKNGWWKFERPG